MIKNELSFQFIGNACGIFEGSKGTKILCDPWIVDGVFEGSWCHFHKLSTRMEDLEQVDAIYISHLHPDHFDERYFGTFRKDIPIICLDHGENFLIRKLKSLGYENLKTIRDRETIAFKEFSLTMFAPFAKHNFHEAELGNLIDSALLFECGGVRALNANDNTPTPESAEEILNTFGPIDLAMLNYNAAGPYPSCFSNLSESEKVHESERVLVRNFSYVRDIILSLKPRFVLPFAGAYVLGGKLHYKNRYLGTATWDRCADWLIENGIPKQIIVLMQELTKLNIKDGSTEPSYRRIQETDTKVYIESNLSKMKYPNESDESPDSLKLMRDLQTASELLKTRMDRRGIKSRFTVFVDLFSRRFSIYPKFEERELSTVNDDYSLVCKLDERLLRRILDKKAHWNNAEIGAHIEFHRVPNEYEPDLHTGLQFLHL